MEKYAGGDIGQGDSSELQGDLNFKFDQRESKVNLHKSTSSLASPSNVSPEPDFFCFFKNKYIA